MMESTVLLYSSLTALVGYLAAFAELLSRYKNPVPILKSFSSEVYMFINASSGFLAYWYLSGKEISEGNEISMILVAGTSSMVLLRSSFASIKIGDKNVEAGFASILQVFLNWADRTFDQKKAISSLPSVGPTMKEVDFEKAKLALPITCFRIMKNVSQEEQDKMASEIAILTQSGLDNKVKCINLGILLMDYTGAELLNEAINSLGDSIMIKADGQSDSTKLDELMKKLKK